MKLHENSKDPRTIKFFTTLETTLNSIHNSKYDYSETVYITKRHTFIYKCPEHGYVEQNAGEHYRGSGCFKCGVVIRTKNTTAKTNKTLISSFIKVHGDKYNYSKVDYINGRVKVIIVCPIHGDFLQRPDDHKSGYGCPKCARENSGFTRSRLKGKPTILYHILINNLYHKVGVCTTSVRERYKREKGLDYKILSIHLFMDGAEAFDLELKILRLTRKHTYNGDKLLKGGNTEIRTIDLTDVITSVVNR